VTQTQFSGYLLAATAIILLSCNFLFDEIRQLKSLGFYAYISSFFNIMDVLSLTFNILISLSAGWELFLLPYMDSWIACATVLILLRCFYWMQFFKKTGLFVTLIFESVTKINHFLLLYAMIMFTFGVPLYVLSLSREGTEHGPLISSHFGWAPLDIINSMYLVSLGEFESMPDYDGKNHFLIWSIFVSASFFV